MLDSGRSTHRWRVLAIAAATHTFAAALPYSCLPALFKEISEELGLSLVQIGTVWGMVSLAGVFVAITAGLLGDRFGVRRVLGLACVLAGVTGALRGLSTDFASLAVTFFLFGLIRWIIPVNVHKAISLWFRGKNLGAANGVVSMGMGVGLMLGPMISATIMSPLLGGWRNVLYLYGAVSVVIGLLWTLTKASSSEFDQTGDHSSELPVRHALTRLIRIKALWLLGLTLLFRMGSVTAMIGYLPLYLRDREWSIASADGTVAALYAASTIAVIPLAILSDRLGTRKVILFFALLTSIASIGFLPVVDDITIWILIILVGVSYDGFMAIILTMVQETEGVGKRFSGIALGLVFTISQFGVFISAPLGNNLASINPGSPFIFWAALPVVALITLAFTRETGRRRIQFLGY